MTRLFTFIILSCALGCTETSDTPSEAPPAHVISGETMGTTYTIRLTDLNDGVTLESIQVAVDKELATVNQQMSTYICLLYTSPSPRDPKTSRMPSSA